MNKITKILCTTLLFIFILTISFSTFAANVSTKTKLQLVEDNSAHVDIGNGAGEFDKKLTNFDETKRSATLSLSVKNTGKNSSKLAPTEILLVIDNSASMVENKVGTETRKDVVINAAKKLTTKLFDANPNMKIGVVSFSSLDSVAGEKEGTINDAKKILDLTSSKDSVTSAIDTVSSSKNGPRTNIEAGLTVAEQAFSSDADTKRYIVLLTDGIPNNALDGTFGVYSGTVATRTKAKIEAIKAKNIDIIGAMIGLDGNHVETQSGKTYEVLAQEVFGTAESSTLNSYYNIPDDKNQIEATIAEQIYSDIIQEVDATLKNIKIKDYFPQEIIENFDFAYVDSPNLGEISPKVNTEDNSIVWTIPELAPGETATVSYTLTLKSNYSKDIVDKVLPTNEKVDIEADLNDTKITETTTESPKVKVTETVTPIDNTVTPDPIPQTGEDNLIFIVLIGFFSVIIISRYIALKKMK